MNIFRIFLSLAAWRRRGSLLSLAGLAALSTFASLEANEQPVEIKAVGASGSDALFSFKAVDLEIKQALALFAEANSLNILPDQDIQGTVTATFRDLPLELAMEALLDAHGYYFTMKGSLIRVRNFQTRVFQIDYINTIRIGSGSNDVQFSSRGGSESEGSTMSVTANSTIDFWDSLRIQLESMISEDGSFAVNSLAGVVSVTERFARMDQIASMIAQIGEAVVRQVELEVEIYEVVTDDTEQLGVDWTYITQTLGSTARVGGNLILPPGSTSGGAIGNAINIEFSRGADRTVLLEALRQQGELRVLSRPKLRTLNNQPAVIRVGQDLPVFRQTVTQSPSNPPVFTVEEEIVNITIGTVLSITPQISADGMITLDVTPAISRLVRNELSAVTGASAPVIDVRQSSSIVRIRNGTTIVLGGLVQTQTSSVKRKVPLLGDIPGLGKVFQGHRNFSQNNELVIVLTPTIIE